MKVKRFRFSFEEPKEQETSINEWLEEMSERILILSTLQSQSSKEEINGLSHTVLNITILYEEVKPRG